MSDTNSSSSSEGVNTQNTCIICYTNYGEPSRDSTTGRVTEAEERMVLGGCGHAIGTTCFTIWCIETGQPPHCPTCRREICTYCNNPISVEPIRDSSQGPRILHGWSSEILTCGHYFHHACMEHWRTEMRGKTCPNEYCADPQEHLGCGHTFAPRLQNHWQTPSPDMADDLGYCVDCYMDVFYAHQRTILREYQQQLSDARSIQASRGWLGGRSQLPVIAQCLEQIQLIEDDMRDELKAWDDGERGW